jgi:dihydrofolate reductase
MRKLIYGINLTLDGCCDHTKGDPNEELHDYYTQMLGDMGLLLYGRTTYELMVPFWPDAAKSQDYPRSFNDFARAFDALDRVVVSRTLTHVPDKQTTIINTNIYDEILKLKQQDGKPIMTGGVSLPLQLAEMGLVDEFNFVIQPILAGEGRRLVDPAGIQQRLNLKLADTKVFDSGSVALRYVKG